MNYKYIGVIMLVALYAGQAGSDGTMDSEPDGKLNEGEIELNDDQRRAVRAFFEKGGIEIFDEAIKKYSFDVIERMASVVEDLEKAVERPRQIWWVNELIYENELKKANLTKRKAPELEEEDFEVILKTIDMIVPDSWSDAMIKSYKSELNQFYKEKPELGKELLLKFHEELYYAITTKFVLRKLRHCYYHWIPLSSLADYVENNASN